MPKRKTTKPRRSTAKPTPKTARPKPKLTKAHFVAAARVTTNALRVLRKGVPGLPSLDAEARKRLAKPRKEAEEHVRAMDALLGRRGDVLKLPGLAAGEIALAWDRAESLQPLQAELARFSQAVDDAVLADKGRAWAAALEVYNLARSLSQRVPELTGEVEGFERFLAHGPRADQAPGASSPAAPPA